MDNPSLRETLRLHLAEGVGAVLFRRICQAFGSVEEAARASAGQLTKVRGVGDKTAEAIRAVTDDVIDEELAIAADRGVRVLTRGDGEYPEALRHTHDPPAVLYVRGQLQATDAVAVGVVGSRRCTHYGAEQAGRFGQLLGRAGFTVVSGGARGIDAAAHRGAMAAGGRTIAVMGCGLSTLYPPENADLFEQIVADGGGALLSELPMRTAVLSGNFPTRNRIISGLSLGVLVVEAARRSGSLITARVAAEQGREVFALPGRVDSPMSQGTNELIRDGAILVQNLADMLEHLGEVGESLAEEDTDATMAVPPGLDDRERKLYDVLCHGPASLDELVRRADVDSGQAASAMTMLVLKGVVVQRAGSVFALRSDSAARTGTTADESAG